MVPRSARVFFLDSHRGGVGGAAVFLVFGFVSHDVQAMTYSKHGQRSAGPIQDLISSVILGAILGVTFYVLDSITGLSGHATRQMGIPHVGGRIGVLQFVILGGVVGAVMDLVGKLRRYGA